MMWARRLAIAAGLALASMAAVPGIAAAAAPNCPTTNGATVTPSMTATCPVVVPAVAGGSQTLPSTGVPGSAGATSTSSGSSTAGTSSLPFTGADVEELAVIGGAALVVGVLLMRRRRTVQV